MWNHIILFWCCTSVIYNKYVNFFGNFSHFVFLFCVTGKPLLPCYTNYYYYYKSETENSDCVLLVLIEYLQKGHCKEHQQSQHVMSSVLAGTPRFRANKRCESHQKSQDISSSYFTFKAVRLPQVPPRYESAALKRKKAASVPFWMYGNERWSLAGTEDKCSVKWKSAIRVSLGVEDLTF